VAATVVAVLVQASAHAAAMAVSAAQAAQEYKPNFIRPPAM
jgi:hypothetical protein